MSVKDSRNAPFVWASVAALQRLRDEWDGERAEVHARIGVSVYHALCELANKDRARMAIGTDSGKFKTSKTKIGEWAMTSAKSVERACAELERIGLLFVESDHEGQKRPGRPSYYTLVEPDQTSVESTDVDENERPKPVRTPSEASSDVPPPTSEESTDVPNKEKKNSKKEKEVCSTATLPELIDAPLRQAADAKGGHLDPDAVVRACKSYPGRDHAGEAEKFAAWHLRGNGANAPLRDVAPAFRSWLEKAPVSPPRSQDGSATPRSIPTEAVAETDRATEAWKAAKRLLSQQLPDSTFRNWIDPLEVAGERVGRLVLVDTSSNGGLANWVDRKYRPLILEATEGFNDLEIVDETQLELEAA